MARNPSPSVGIGKNWVRLKNELRNYQSAGPTGSTSRFAPYLDVAVSFSGTLRYASRYICRFVGSGHLVGRSFVPDVAMSDLLSTQIIIVWMRRIEYMPSRPNASAGNCNSSQVGRLPVRLPVFVGRRGISRSIIFLNLTYPISPVEETGNRKVEIGN